ncbi:MAG: radical SAM protein, partial [bacterium]
DMSHAHKLVPSARKRRPVVVWNVTRTCNLRCIHCYTDSEEKRYSDELTTVEAKAMIDDLADYGVPALLLSGGEPLMRKDIFELAAHAQSRGVRTVLSTNATLISPEIAHRIKDLGMVYVGASLDGIGRTNDRFRGKGGAFRRAVEGIRNCKAVGLKISLRMTLTRHNVQELDQIFNFVEKEKIERLCFYHLAYAGRGRSLSGDDLSPAETRLALHTILEKTKGLHQRGLKKDVLTVDNHADGVYIYLKLLKENPERAKKVKQLLEWNGGGANSSGVGIADIDFRGDVHADQFWMDYAFGNVRERRFSHIWEDTSDPLMAGLKDRLPLLKGRCAQCRWIEMCGGSLRVRAQFVHNDPWAEDPACYLTDEEIGISEQLMNECLSGNSCLPVIPNLFRNLLPRTTRFRHKNTPE